MTVAVLAQAAQVSQASAGAFDVTVAPLVDAWGFGPRRRSACHAMPTCTRRGRRWAGGASTSTWRQALPLRCIRRARLVRHRQGFAVDLLRRRWTRWTWPTTWWRREARSARGPHADGLPWRVAGRRRRRAAAEGTLRRAALDQSMATSGDYRIFFEADGRRHCHEIDPSTGRPIFRAASVSVVAGDCAYATRCPPADRAGPERGFALATAGDIAAHFILRNSGGSLHDRSTRPSPHSDAAPRPDCGMYGALLTVFLLALALIGAGALATAIGVIFRRPCLRGSCGGPPATAPTYRSSRRMARRAARDHELSRSGRSHHPPARYKCRWMKPGDDNNCRLTSRRLPASRRDDVESGVPTVTRLDPTTS